MTEFGVGSDRHYHQYQKRVGVEDSTAPLQVVRVIEVEFGFSDADYPRVKVLHTKKPRLQVAPVIEVLNTKVDVLIEIVIEIPEQYHLVYAKPECKRHQHICEMRLGTSKDVDYRNCTCTQLYYAASQCDPVRCRHIYLSL